MYPAHEVGEASFEILAVLAPRDDVVLLHELAGVEVPTKQVERAAEEGPCPGWSGAALLQKLAATGETGAAHKPSVAKRTIPTCARFEGSTCPALRRRLPSRLGGF
ncbi:MAG: hypothetical protein IT377_17270 [Polyangiaceae bacterium]|nr:hypothetical protein [Polyangiaceae bacterium]